MKIDLHQRKLFFLLSTAFLLISCKVGVSEENDELEIYNEIQALIKARDYFAARDLLTGNAYKLSEFQQLKVGAKLDNIFNQPASSNKKIDKLNKEFSTRLTDSTNYVLLTTEMENYIKLYDYDNAKEATKSLLTNFPQFIEEEKKTSLNNMLIIWEALKDQPKQKITTKGSTHLQITNDKAGLKNIKIKKDNYTIDFIFDTGANFSTITETIAQQFDMEILTGVFEVNSITGQKINSKIAIAPEIFLGKIKIENAVFLVFPDSALAFPQIDYQINGILGLPVIEALGEIQLTRDNQFIVPEVHTQSEEKNLALEFLTPLILLRDETGIGTYTFDTGALKSMLYSTYFERYKSTRDSIPEEVDYTFAGAGGAITLKGIYINYNPEINGKLVPIDSVIVLKTPINTNTSHLGNLGQDLISQFEKLTINFDQMFISLN